MKKLIIVFALSVFISSAAFSQIQVDSIGNVGIGISLPTTKLDVSGLVRLRSLINNNALDSVLVVNVIGEVYYRSAISLVAGSETDPVFIASPAFGISVFDTANWNTAYGWGNHALAGYLTSFAELDPVFAASLAFGINGADTTNWNTAFGWGDHVLSGYLTAETDPQVGAIDTSYVPRWNGGALVTGSIYDVGGNVGIGTTSPVTKLDVEGSTTSIQNVLNVNANYNLGNYSVRAINGNSVLAPGYGYGVFGTGGYMGVSGLASATTYTGNAFGVYGRAKGSAGDRYGVYGLATNAGGTTAYGVYGNASGATNNWAGYFTGRTYVGGDLGIGTITPDNKLDVVGKISVTQSTNDEMVIINDDVWQHADGNQDFGDGGDHFIMASKELTSESAGIYGDGDHVTIWSPGDGAPGQTQAYIYVNDEDFFDNDLNPFNDNALKAYLNTAGNWIAASDRNRKENIQPLKESLEKILQVNGYSFNFKLAPEEIKKGDKKITTYGVIAQEVDKVFPEIVDKSAGGEYFVSYTEFIPLLIESIKEQQKEITELKSTVNALVVQIAKIDNKQTVQK